MSGPFVLSNESSRPEPRAITTATPTNATTSPTHAPSADAVEPEREREDHRHAGREGDDERRDPGRRIPRTDIQEHVVADDDEQPGRSDTDGVSAREPGKPAGTPEDVREAGHGDRVAKNRDVARRHAVVEQLLDHGEGPRPDDHHREHGHMRFRVHCSGQRARRLHREVVNAARRAILPPA